MGVPSGVQSNHSCVSGCSSVHWVDVLKDLDVQSKLKFEVIVVGIWAYSQYGEWAQGAGDAILSCELVQCLGRVENELLNHQFGETFEREVMYGGSGVLLHCPNEMFNFSNVIISGGTSSCDGSISFRMHSYSKSSYNLNQARALKNLISVEVASA